MASLEQQAASLGIPMRLEIDDGTRYDYCDAHMAQLTDITGTKATYQGECNNGHLYTMEYEISELQDMVSIENGELVYGAKKEVLPPLEEY